MNSIYRYLGKIFNVNISKEISNRRKYWDEYFFKTSKYFIFGDDLVLCMDSEEEIRSTFKDWCEKSGGTYEEDVFGKPARKGGVDSCQFDYHDEQHAYVNLDPKKRKIYADQPHGGAFVIDNQQLDDMDTFTHSVETLSFEDGALKVKNGIDKSSLSNGFPCTIGLRKREDGTYTSLAWGACRTEDGEPLGDVVGDGVERTETNSYHPVGDRSNVEGPSDVPNGTKVEVTEEGIEFEDGTVLPREFIGEVWDNTDVSEEGSAVGQYRDGEFIYDYDEALDKF